MNDAVPHSPSSSPTPPRGAWNWLKIFGPGAVVASLSIGTGELMFSTRGGAIFGYRVLLLFVVISILKWGLVVSSARHFVLTGVHPYRRMLDLPGPRGWLPLILSLIAFVCLPIWVSFFPGVLGNLVSNVTNTGGLLQGGIDYVWGAILLAGVIALVATTGYTALERVQLAFVSTMLICSVVALVLHDPDWVELIRGAIVPQPLEYPVWLPEKYPEVASESVWVETTRYVGVIGGASFDYMAYTTWLREKRWGRAGGLPATESELATSAAEPNDNARRWAKAASIDCGLSFTLVIAFSAVFVASGVLLGESETIPSEDNFLVRQAEFMASIHGSLRPIYLVGAFLTILGTLYGTIEVGCSIAAEMAQTWNPYLATRHRRRIRIASLTWFAVGAFAILAWLTAYHVSGGEDKPRLLLTILTPANLFTGVLGCGIICAVNCWIDRRFLPAPLRMGRALFALNVIAAPIFLFLGLKGYWEHKTRWFALASLGGLLAIGFIGAALLALKRRQSSRSG